MQISESIHNPLQTLPLLYRKFCSKLPHC